MLKKIAIFLFMLLIIQMALYARLYATDLIEQAETINKTLSSRTANYSENEASAYLKDLGIETSVDEAGLEEKYKSAKVVTEPSNGNAIIGFYNPNSDNFRIDIYDFNEGLVASFINVKADKVVISKEIFDAGAYIYKLSDESNIYCGTFVLR